jgi:hypothetical protein
MRVDAVEPHPDVHRGLTSPICSEGNDIQALTEPRRDSFRRDPPLLSSEGDERSCMSTTRLEGEGDEGEGG